MGQYLENSKPGQEKPDREVKDTILRRKFGNPYAHTENINERNGFLTSGDLERQKVSEQRKEEYGDGKPLSESKEPYPARSRLTPASGGKGNRAKPPTVPY